MGATRSTRIPLAGRGPVGSAVVGVLRATMDEELGIPVAELHIARSGHPGRRIEVHEGQAITLGADTYRVDMIRPYSGRSPAGIVLAPAVLGGDISAELG